MTISITNDEAKRDRRGRGAAAGVLSLPRPVSAVSNNASGRRVCGGSGPAPTINPRGLVRRLATRHDPRSGDRRNRLTRTTRLTRLTRISRGACAARAMWSASGARHGQGGAGAAFPREGGRAPGEGGFSCSPSARRRARDLGPAEHGGGRGQAGAEDPAAPAVCYTERGDTSGPRCLHFLPSPRARPNTAWRSMCGGTAPTLTAASTGVVRIAPNRAAAPRDSRFGRNERLGDSAIRRFGNS